jgi:hypothetical protein
MMKKVLMSPPIDPGHQLRVLTDNEMDKVTGGLRHDMWPDGDIRRQQSSTTAIGAVNERLALGKGMIDVA